jgi:peptidoglycan hydrolase-like protein with peptidoglycan-binding domain
METLAYLHLALADETPTDFNLGERLDWRTFSSQAGMYLLPVIVALGVLGMAGATLAQPFRQGNKGPEITVIQERLQQLGYYNQYPDGNFGPGTRNAIIQFQQEKGLVPDGIAGSETIAELFRSGRQNQFQTYDIPSINPDVDTQTFSASRRTDVLQRDVLQRGDRGSRVRRLQERLSDQGFYPGSIDGIFGSQTERAVRQFQRSKGLYPSGVANSDTLTALGIRERDQKRYVVVIPVRDENTLYEVRAIRGFGDATLAESKRGNYVSAGTFPNRALAESRSYLLRSRGLDARVAYNP